jgi:hypothetical protein
MTNNLRAVLAAAALLSTAPASAALFTYNFTAGGQNVYSYAENYNYSCDYTGGGCSQTIAADTEAFTLSGQFTVDTSKLPADGFGGANGAYYDSYPNQDPAVQFLSGSMIKTGGTLAIPNGVGGARSYLYTYDQQYSAGDAFFQAFAQAPGSTLNSVYEYNANGSLARQYYLEEYIGFYTYDPGLDLGVVDGADLAIGFSQLLSNGYASMGRYLQEYRYDQFGNLLSYTQTSLYAQAQLTSVNAVPGGPSTEVPEPAMLGLFGLGIAGLAARRRRRHAA